MFPVNTKVYLRHYACIKWKLTLEGYLERHSLKHRDPDQAAIFDELRMRKC